MMMNKQVRLNLEDEVREFVGDFNKFFDDLKKWSKDAIQIQTWKDHFLKEYPKMFGNSSGTEMDVDVDTTMWTKPPIDREEKLRKVEEKLLSKRTNERFTDCDGVMLDPNLTLTQKIIHLQKGLRIQREERFTTIHYKENYLKNAVFNPRKFIKKLWRKRSLQDGGCYFYENYTNLLWNTIKSCTALFL